MNETRTHAFKIIGFEEPVLQYGDPECPLFSAVEICRTLGIRNFNCAINRLDADSRFEITLTDANGKPERLTLINMAGVYDLALSNNTPKAEKFQQWVFREVLPSIRKTGSYDISSRRRENEYQQQLLELPSDWTRLVPTSTVVELFAVWGADYMSTQASSLGTQIVDLYIFGTYRSKFPAELSDRYLICADASDQFTHHLSMIEAIARGYPGRPEEFKEHIRRAYGVTE